MQFGLHLERKAPPGLDPETMLEELLAQTRTAREAGFDVITTGQHFLVEDFAMLQTVPLLSRLSAETGPMSVMTGVVLLPLLHPVDVAESIATLDVLAEGVIAGVGAGYRDEEFESFGVPKAERGPRLAEGIEVLRRLWTEGTVTFDGDFYALDGVGTGLRPDPTPPIWVAANTRPAIERAARIGDGWYVNPHSTIGEIAEHKRAYDAIRRDRNEPTDTPLFRECFVAPTHEEAVGIAGPHLAAKYGPEQYLKWGQDEAMEDPRDLHRGFDELREDRFLLGTPEEVCAEIDRIDETVGVSHLILRVQWPGLATDRVLECLELVGDEVIPNV